MSVAHPINAKKKVIFNGKGKAGLSYSDEQEKKTRASVCDEFNSMTATDTIQAQCVGYIPKKAEV